VAADLVLALDEGTTSARSIVFDRSGAVVAVAQREFEQQYPSPGDVRHDPEAIWAAQLATAHEAIDVAGGVDRIAAIGVTNQRETAVVWDRATGAAVADAIVWQSRVTRRSAIRFARQGTSRWSGIGQASRSTPTSPGRRSARSSPRAPGFGPGRTAASWRPEPWSPS
jgi:glycerol kinase